MTPTKPTPQGISRLLAAAGFERSERQIGGYGSGFVAEKDRTTEGALRVWHRFWSMGGGDAAPWLAKYAEAIAAAGWAVRAANDPFGKPCLIVTAKPAEPVITTTMFTPAEQAAWEVAVERGLAITAADLRAMLGAASLLAAKDGDPR